MADASQILLACFNAASPPAAGPNEIWDLFVSVHENTLSASNLNSALEVQGLRLAFNESADVDSTQVYCGSQRGMAVLVEQMNMLSLGSDITYAVYSPNTSQEYSAQVATRMVKWRQNQLPEPFEDDDGWETVAWSVDDDNSPQVGFSVGHNEEFGVTKIWGHQIHIGTE